MSSKISRAGIFVATMTGLAELCAEEIEAAMDAAGMDCTRQLMDGLDSSALEPFDLIVIVSSTYGHGEIPDNGLGLFASIEAGADLSSKAYAVFALGDRTYADTFCAAGDRWEKLLKDCGGRPLIETERHNASSGTLAEDVAGAWATAWAQALV